MDKYQELAKEILFAQLEAAIQILRENEVDLSKMATFDTSHGLAIEFDWEGKTFFIVPGDVNIKEKHPQKP